MCPIEHLCENRVMKDIAAQLSAFRLRIFAVDGEENPKAI